jgi:hypothetical protein
MLLSGPLFAETLEIIWRKIELASRPAEFDFEWT